MNPAGLKKIQILILDDHDLFREGLARLLEAEPDFSAVQCSTVREALQVVSKTAIDIVLLDYDLGLQRGSEFLTRARQENFQGRILVVTAGLSDKDAAQLLRDGVAGIFSKHSSPELLAKCLRQVIQGAPWIDIRYANALARVPEADPDGRKPTFTDRERAILRGVFEGLGEQRDCRSLECF